MGDDETYAVFVDDNKVYVATYRGLSISTDGSATFTNRTTANGLGSNYVKDVFVVGDTVYAATAGGLSISTDGGATFANRTTASGLGSNGVNSVYAAGNSVYAATYSGLAISTDGGMSFVNRTASDGLGSDRVYDVYIEGSTIYAGLSGPTIAISTDGGSTWSWRWIYYGLVSNDLSLFVLNGTIYAASADHGLFISTDNGDSWSRKTTANGLPANIASDVFVDGGLLFVTGRGLSISTDGGSTFINRDSSHGLPYDTWASAVFAQGNTVYVATYDGLAIGTCAPLTPTPTVTPTPAPQAIDALLAYWKFDEGTGSSVADSSGSGHDLTLYGYRLWSNSGAPLAYANPAAFTFHGYNQTDYAIAAGNIDLANRSFSISVWAKRSRSWAQEMFLIDKSFRHHTNGMIVVKFEKRTGKGMGFQIGLETVS